MISKIKNLVLWTRKDLRSWHAFKKRPFDLLYHVCACVFNIHIFFVMTHWSFLAHLYKANLWGEICFSPCFLLEKFQLMGYSWWSATYGSSPTFLHLHTCSHAHTSLVSSSVVFIWNMLTFLHILSCCSPSCGACCVQYLLHSSTGE